MTTVYSQRDGVLQMRGRPMADADAKELLAFHAEVALDARCAQLKATEEVACSLYDELKAAIREARLVRKIAELDQLLVDLAVWGRRMRDQIKAGQAETVTPANIIPFQRRS